MCDIHNFVLAAHAARVLERTPATVRYLADTERLACIRTLDGVRLFRLEDVKKLKADLDQRAAQEKAGTAA